LRDIDFMVEWYPKLLRQRRLLKWQAWISAAVVIGVLIHVWLERQALSSAKLMSEVIQSDLASAQSKIEQLDKLLGLRRQLESRRSIVESLGLPVETSRLLGELSRCMGPGTSLAMIEMEIVTREPELIASTDRSSPGGSGSQGGPKPKQQFADIKLMGVAPSTSEISHFYGNIVRRPFFMRVSMPNSREASDGNLITREFEMTLSLPLTPASVAPPARGAR